MSKYVSASWAFPVASFAFALDISCETGVSGGMSDADNARVKGAKERTMAPRASEVNLRIMVAIVEASEG